MTDLITIATTIAQAMPAAEVVADSSVVAAAEYGMRGFNHLGAGIALGLGALGGGIGVALVGAATILGIARQPEQAGVLRGLMFVVAALIEGLALIAIVIGMVLAFS